MKNKQHKFCLYRYQLVPLSKNIQSRLDGLYKDYSELVAKKNAIFMEVLTKKPIVFSDNNERVGHKVVASSKDFALMRLNVKKKATLRTKDFSKHEVDDYPDTTIFINNNNAHQIIAIQENKKAFTTTEVIANMMERTLKAHLQTYNLGFYVEALYEVSDFWETIRKYENKITYMKFELIKPNISNISASIKDSLMILGSDTNSHRTDVELNAPENGVLENLNPQNKSLNDLVEYSSVGGAKDPTIKLGKMKKTIKTRREEKSFEINDLQLSGSPIQLAKVLRQLTKL